MTATPQTVAAFEAWKYAELAAHYVWPCPDELMDHIVDRTGEAFDALQAAPANSAEDALLKLFPVILHSMEPGKGEPPLRPSKSKGRTYDDAFYRGLIADLSAVSPQLAAAIEAPNRGTGERA